MIPVNPPRSHPFLFPFPPEINPPINKLKKEMIVMINRNDVSCTEVNVKISEKRRLLIIAIKKIAIKPYKTEMLKPFDSTFLPPF